MEAGVQLHGDQGSGRAFLVLYSEPHYSALAQELFQSLSTVTRAVLLETSIVDDRTWEGLSTQIAQNLSELKVRQASFVCFGAACVLIQNLCLARPRLVRSVVYIDSSTRSHPGGFARLIDSIESVLPLGLPLRLRSQGFDGKPFLQRLRCPALVVTTPMATSYLRQQAEILAQNLPTSWLAELANMKDTDSLKELVLDFQKVPAKCPQRANSRGATECAG